MFDLLPLPRAVLLRELWPVFAILPPAFKPIDVAERAGVRKAELDDTVAVVEGCARVWPQGRFLMEGYERAERRRGADAGSGHGEGRGGGGNWYDWGGLGGS